MSRLSKLGSVAWAFVIGGLAFAWISAFVWWIPGRYPGLGFVYAEPGQNLFLVDRLLAGEVLYRDVFSQYGALPLYALAFSAAWFGNTAAHYLGFTQALSIAGSLLVFELLSRTLGSKLRAAGWTCVVVFPMFLMPGSLVDSGGSIYPSWERLLFLSIALVWRPPRERRALRGLALGMLIGSFQWMKFGTAAIVLAALVATDLLFLTREYRFRWAERRAWIRHFLPLFGGCLLVELSQALLLFALLPGEKAIDVLWPAYMVGSYKAVADPMNSFWHWYSVGYFAVAQLPFIACAALATLAGAGAFLPRIVRQIAFQTEPRVSSASVFFTLSFALAVGSGFLPHRWTIFPWVWLCGVAGASAFFQARRSLQIVVTLALLPAFLASARDRIGVPGQRGLEGRVALSTPTGETLCGEPSEVRRVDAIVAAVAALSGGSANEQAISVFPLRSGWEHYFGFAHHGGRHAWFVPGFVRPDEETTVLRSIRASRALVLCAYGEPLPPVVTSDPETWGRVCNPRFSAATQRALASMLGDPMRIDEKAVVFPIRQDQALRNR